MTSKPCVTVGRSIPGSNFNIRGGRVPGQRRAGARLSHGDFLPWLQANCSFNERTAQRYMKLNAYRDKCDRVSDLQEAYQQIETMHGPG